MVDDHAESFGARKFAEGLGHRVTIFVEGIRVGADRSTNRLNGCSTVDEGGLDFVWAITQGRVGDDGVRATIGNIVQTVIS